MKKRLSLVLVTVLLASLFSGFSFASAEQPRVLTIGSMTNYDGFLNFDIYKQLQKDLNMTIEFTYYSPDSFSAMLAGGDLPDIVIMESNLSIVMNNKLALDLSPYLDRLPSLTGETYKNTLKLSRELIGGGNNGLYVLCPVVGQHCWNGGTYMTERGYSVNWEYYKEIGCPTISNDDEYIQVLKQMQANHPTGDDGQPSYLYGVIKNLDIMGGFRACFRKDIALNPWTTYLYRSSIYDNSLVNCYTDVEHSSYWADMEFYNKIYREGLWDMDAFTMTYDEYLAKCQNKQYMGVYQSNRNQDIYWIAPSTGSTVYTNILLPLGNCPTDYSFVSANTQNLDLVLEFINRIYDPDFNRTAYSGIEGVDWNYDANGVPSLTEKSIADIASGNSYWTADGNGYGYRNYFLSAYNPAVTHPDGYPMNLAMTDEALIATQSDHMKDFNKVYGVDFWYEAFTNLGMTDFRNDAGEAICAALNDIPMDIQRIIETCNDIMYTAMPTLIMAESDEEFAAAREEVLAELEAAKEPQAWEWYSAAWEEPMKLFNDYLAATLPQLGMELNAKP